MIEIVEYPDSGPEAVLEEFKNRVFATAAESVEWATAPLVHFDTKSEKAIEIRTGVLIEIAGAHFLVTAAHGMKGHFESGDLLQIVVPDKGSAPVPLVAEQWRSTVDPQEDLNVCRLLPRTVDAMGPNFRFLRLSQMMSKNDPENGEGLYLLLGYPNAMTRPDEEGVKRSDPWKYLTTTFHGDYERVSNYDSSLHLILDYDRETYNVRGEKVHPHGLSGCGVYFCGHPISRAVLRHDDLKLVAIQTSWHKGEQYVKATWINDLLLILWKYYPEVRAPMRLHGINF